MLNTRRAFFATLTKVSLVTGLFTKAPLAMAAQSLVSPPVKNFPVKLSVKYFMPKGKKPFEGMDEISSCQYHYKALEIFNALEASGEVSSYTEFKMYDDHVVLNLFFKELDGYLKYSKMMKGQEAIKLLENNLGYKIIWEVT